MTPSDTTHPLPVPGIVAIWHDITTEGMPDFIEWHNREHMPERLSIDGFQRGRRYVTEQGNPGFFTLYNVRDRSVLSGADYLAKLNHPTPWTRRANTYFSNESRSLCDVLFSRGVGMGGMLGTIRFDCQHVDDDNLQRTLCDDILPAIAAYPAISSISLSRADTDISRIRTAEHEGRVDNTVPRWVLLVEAGEKKDIDAVFSSSLSREILKKLGVQHPLHAVHRLQHDLTK